MDTYSKNNEDGLYYRLIALWVVCEAMLGGIIHGFKLPVSGLLVGSCAVVCISLIAWYIPAKHAILKATVIVAIFKMLLSPQAPFPAYIAVFFQGITGHILFHNRKYFKVSCLVFAMLALIESGLQRIFVLTIVYGKDLWVVVNQFINGLTKQKNDFNYSLLIAGVYTAVHLVAGILVGSWVSRVPGKIEKWRLLILPRTQFSERNKKRTKKKFKKWWIVIWVLLVIIYIQSYYNIGDPLLPSYIPLRILLRSLIIVVGWIFIAAPLFKLLLHAWLAKKQSVMRAEIAAIFEIIPSIESALVSAWKQSSVKSGFGRVNYFGKLALANTIYTPMNNVIIFSRPIRTGKTTELLEWIKKRHDVYGILTPEVNGKRKFYNIESAETFNMEASESEEKIVIGKFQFSKLAFTQAEQIISGNINKDGWLIIDEVGPLELDGNGFSAVLKEALLNRKYKLLLVVRESLVEQVVSVFEIKGVSVIHSLESLNG
jgi:nucleoside-triphosphatase THEP1